MNSIKIFLGNHRKSAIAVLTVVVLFILASFVVASYETWIRPYREKKALEAWQAKLEKPYREDVFGGATPEETWGLFLNALRNGDIDLASKYFVVDKQGEMKNKFAESKNLGRFDEALKFFSFPLEKQKNNEFINKDSVYYVIPFKNKENKIEAYPVNFYLNNYTKIWKIIEI